MLKRIGLVSALLLVFMVTPSFCMSMEDVSVGEGVDPVYSVSDDVTLYDLAQGVDDGIMPLITNVITISQNTASGVPIIQAGVSGSADLTIDSVITQNARSTVGHLVTLFNMSDNQQAQINALSAAQDSIADVIKEQLGFPDGKSLYGGLYNCVDIVTGNLFPGTFFDVMTQLVTYQFHVSTEDLAWLSFDGSISVGAHALSTPVLLDHGFLGLASILRGESGSTITGELLNYGDLSATEFSANNILSMLSPLLNLQNDVARLAHVIADPEDQALNDANKDNKQEILDSFGSDSSASVSTSDIGDMAGVSEGLTGNLNTGVTVGDMFGQINDSSRWSFFSQETASNLDTVPVTYSEDDDFVEFYDPENKALFELLGRDLP